MRKHNPHSTNPSLYILALILGSSLAIGLSTFATSIGNNVSVTGTLSSTGALSITTTSATSSVAYGLTIATSGGNVGIGTSTPNNLLSVYDLIDFNNTDSNTKVGYQAGKYIVSGAARNTFLGYQAGYSDSTASTNTASSNTAVGYRSLYSITTGNSNTAVGRDSLLANTTGIRNTALGRESLYTNTTGGYNLALGFESAFYNTTGSDNTVVGGGSLLFNSTGSYNTTLGMNALQDSLGSNSVALGYEAGAHETGSNAFYVDVFDRLNIAGDKANALLYGTFASTGANDQNLTINAHLNVTGTSTFTGNATFNGSIGSASTSPWGLLSINPNNITGPEFAVGSTTGTSFIIDNGGKVGIGTTTPFANFSIDTPNNTSTSTLNIGTKNSTTKGSCIQMYTPTGAPVRLYATTTSAPPVFESGACQ